MRVPESFEIGVVTGAHGIGGVLRVRMFCESSRVSKGRTLTLRAPDSDRRVVLTVRDVAEIPGKPGHLRISCEQIGDRDAAQALLGYVLELSRDAAMPAAADEFFLVDAIGLPVLQKRDDGDPLQLGTVVAITSNGAQDLFEVRYRAKDGRTRTWLLPVLPHVIRDVTAQAVWIDPPLGLVPDELEDGV